MVLEDHAEPVPMAVTGHLADVVEHHQAVADPPSGAEKRHRLLAVDGRRRQLGRGRLTGLQVQQRRKTGRCRVGAKTLVPEVACRRIAQPSGEERQHLRADPFGLAAVADPQEVRTPVRSRRVPGGAHVLQVLHDAGKRFGNHLRDLLAETRGQHRQSLDVQPDGADPVPGSLSTDALGVPRRAAELLHELQREPVQLGVAGVPPDQEGGLHQQRQREQDSLIHPDVERALLAQLVGQDVGAEAGEGLLDRPALFRAEAVVQHVVGDDDAEGGVRDPEGMVQRAREPARMPADEAVPVGQSLAGLRPVQAAAVLGAPVVAVSRAQDPPASRDGVLLFAGDQVGGGDHGRVHSHPGAAQTLGMADPATEQRAVVVAVRQLRGDAAVRLGPDLSEDGLLWAESPPP